MKPRSWTSLGTLLPLLAFLFPLADGILRFALPLDLLAFRAWEALTARHAWPAPFRPDTRFESDRSYGDLANLANLPGMRAYRREVFTSDPLGCRNPRIYFDDRRIDSLFLGSSIIAGSGVSDDETIPAWVGRLGGTRVYNAGGMANPPRELVERIESHFAFRGPVFREVLVREDVLPELNQAPAAPPRPTSWPRIEAFERPSPLGIVVQRALRRLANDRWLPNPSRGNIVQLTLADGQPTLFFSGELPGAATPETSPAPPERDPLADWLIGRGHPVLVVLIPGKYQALRSMLVQDPVRHDGPERVHRQLAANLRRAGYTVVDTLPAVAAAIRPHPHDVFWADDTHLTPAGCRIVATEIERAWRPMRAGGARGR